MYSQVFSVSKTKQVLLLAVALLTGSFQAARADYDTSRPKPKPGDNKITSTVAASAANCAAPVAKAILEINNVRCLIRNGGDMWFENSNPLYEVPKTTSSTEVKRNSMFAGGIWIGGRDKSDVSKILVQAQTYRQGGQMTFWPGPIDPVVATTNRQRCAQFDELYEARKSVVRTYVNQFNGGLIRSDDDIPDMVKFWPGKNSFFLPQKTGKAGMELDYDLAQFVDVDGDGNYNPLSGDYPRLRGDKYLLDADHQNRCRQMQYLESGADQMLWYITNDVGNTKNFGGAQTNDAIGLEVHTEAFAYATADATNNMTFYRQIIINKGTKYLENCYFGQFADPDLGFSGDDYVEVNVPRGLGICYNGTDFDPGVTGYGANPPSIGVDYFIGPQADAGDGIDNDKDGTIDEPGEKIIMSNFMYYTNGAGPTYGDPTTAVNYYTFLQSKWKNDQFATYDYKQGRSNPGAAAQGNSAKIAIPYKFIFPGVSDLEVCWGSDGANRSNPCPEGRSDSKKVLARWDETSAGTPAGDRRFLGSAGPFTLMPGAVNQLTVGVVWARASAGGARGSFQDLLTADDMSQRLFDRDFELIAGPPHPDLTIVELDGSLLLSWPDVPNSANQNTVITDCGVFNQGSNGGTIENYSVLDPGLKPEFGDTYYRFQGYIVYQVLDDKVSAGDLYDQNKARIVAQCDLKDGVANVSNIVFNSDAGGEVPKVMVTGENKGLSHSIKITRDLFHQEYDHLLNNNKYYFIIVAYATNFNTEPTSTQHFLVNRLGDGEDLVDVGIPHLTESERGGTTLLTQYGDLVNFTRIHGYGTGGLQIDSLIAADEAEIVKNSSKDEISYARNHGPVEIKVYNPKRVKSAQYMIDLTSRVTYSGVNLPKPKVGDIIVADYDYSIYAAGGTTLTRRYINAVQTQGKAKVLRVLETGGDSIHLDVQMLNDELGGTFLPIFEQWTMVPQGNDPPQPGFSTYEFVPTKFYVENDPSYKWNVKNFVKYDYWAIYDKTKPADVLHNTHLNSEFQEELIPELGLSVKITNVPSPGFKVAENRKNGFQGFDIAYKDYAKFWLAGLGFAELGGKYWTQKDADFSDFDPAGIYARIQYNFGDFYSSTGLAAAYFSSRTPVFDQTTSPGPRYASSPSDALKAGLNFSEDAWNLITMHNVDLVYTSDTSQWTRCVVLQYDMDNNEITDDPRRHLLKSKQLSVGKNGEPTGEGKSITYTRGTATRTVDTTSRGMGWFPGYAIDLDRGIRLNMMFSESKLSDPATYSKNGQTRVRGNDLVFDFPFQSATNSFVYVMNTKYDQGKVLETTLDSTLFALPRIPTDYSALGSRMAFNFAKNAMWVTQPIIISAKPFATPTRMKFRVDREFVSYPNSGDNPRYQFSTDGLEASLQNLDVAKKALATVRVVPNPYYGFSEYENDQLDHRVRITNLPDRCVIRIFNLSGTLVRTIQHDQSYVTADNSLTSEDWNLQTQDNLPIAGGVYLIHIDAGAKGSTVVKWFGALRPTDLNGNTF
ncbi:MAG: hypothetical protein V4543_12690 [Bacteroidota bacterium]